MKILVDNRRVKGYYHNRFFRSMNFKNKSIGVSSMYKLKIRELVFVSLFIALITVGTFIRIPVGTDVYTLQFLFTLMAGLVLGARLGALAVGTYVLMGLLGIPVFASGGGPAYVLQPTFGYLVGFIVQAYVCGKYSRGIKTPKFKNLLIANSIGMAIVYLFGSSYFYFASNYIVYAPIAFGAVVFYCGVLQVIPDFILCVLAAELAERCYQVGIWLNWEPADSRRPELS